MSRKIVLLFFTSLFLSCSVQDAIDLRSNSHSNSDDPDFSIQNGEEVASGSRAFSVALGVKRTVAGVDYFGVFCSGSLIGRSMVLTAAHCVHDMDEAIYIRPGAAGKIEQLAQYPTAGFSRFDETIRQVVSTKVHTEWSSSYSRYKDFALVTLNKPIEGFPLGLVADSNKVNVGKSVFLLGYGMGESGATPTNSLTGFLRKGENSIDAFSSSYIEITEDQLSCPGDSGGPMYFEDGKMPYVIGVVHGGSSSIGSKVECGKQIYSLYGNATAQSNWIYSNSNVATDINAFRNAYAIEKYTSVQLNWGGAKEKWFKGTNVWFFILPSGHIFLWDKRDTAGTFGNGVDYSKLVAKLGPEYYSTFDNLFPKDPGIETIPFTTAYLLDLVNEFAGTPSSYNWGSMKEYWFKNEAGTKWYFVVPHGEVYAWNRLDSRASLMTNGVKYSKIIGRVTEAQAAIPKHIIDGVDTVDSIYEALSLTGNPNSYNYLSRQEWWLRGKVNEFGNVWYFIDPNGDVYAWNRNASPPGSMCPCIGHKKLANIPGFYEILAAGGRS